MNLALLHLISHMRAKYQHFLLGPVKHASKQSHADGFDALRHALSAPQANVLLTGVSGPSADGPVLHAFLNVHEACLLKQPLEAWCRRNGLPGGIGGFHDVLRPLPNI